MIRVSFEGLWLRGLTKLFGKLFNCSIGTFSRKRLFKFVKRSRK